MIPREDDVQALFAFAEELIRRVGDEALSFYGKGKTQHKFDEDLVTEAELHLANFFQQRVQERFPEHTLYNSNSKEDAYSHGEKRYLWIFDPIDGVANFQAGIPIWGMSLALMENFWPILGLFHMPATHDLFHAQAGQKAYWGEMEIRVAPHTHLNDESLLLTDSRFHQRYHTQFPGKIRSLGCTGAHICYVAMGRADGAVIANRSFQDLAAVRVIIESAGGKIYTLDGTSFDLSDYLDGEKIHQPLLVGAPAISSQIRSCIQETC